MCRACHGSGARSLEFRTLWITGSPAPAVGLPGSRAGAPVVVAAVLDLDHLEVRVQVDLDAGPVALDQLDVIGGSRGAAGALDLAHGGAGDGRQGRGPCPLDRGAGQVGGAVHAGRGPAVVVEVAGTPDEEYQPCRGSGDPLAAQSHRLASCAVLGGSRGDSRRRWLFVGADAKTLQTRAFATDVSQMSFLT